MNHKHTNCSLDVNKWSLSRLKMILALWAALSLHERLSRFVLSQAGSAPPFRVLHYHLQENYFSNEESWPINPHALTFLRLPSVAVQPVKIPFKKFIVQFCSNPSQQAQLWNFHLNWFMSWVGVGGGGAWRAGQKTSAKSLFFKKK